LILEVAMPGMLGLELQSELKRRQLEIPITFITPQRDETVHTSIMAARLGIKRPSTAKASVAQ
jgi:FixJ family two-component response regulator